MTAEQGDRSTAVRLNVLGSLEIVHEPEGVVVPLPTNAAACHVLALFAIKERYERQELVGVLRPDDLHRLNDDDPDERKRVNGNLDQALSNARRALQLDPSVRVLPSQGGSVSRGSLVTITSDLDEFRELARSADAADWRSALRLIRGKVAEYLPGLDPESNWIVRQREAQRREIKALLEQLDPNATSSDVDTRINDLLEGRYVEPPESALSGPRGDDPSSAPQRASATDSPPEIETPPPAPALSGTASTGARAPRVTRTRLVVGALIASAVGLGVAALTLRPTANGASTPPPGSIVNTWTGRVSSRMPTGRAPAHSGAQIEGGQDLRACDISAGLPCAYLSKSTSITARLGDIIEFKQRLFDPSDVPIPYLKLTLVVGPTYGKHEAEELSIEMLIQWPVYPNGVALPAGNRDNIVTIRLPAPGAYYLTYIPKSSTLTSSFNPHLLYRLPDGIMNGGIGLEDVGSPSSCFECADEYERIVSFQARVS